MSNKLLLSSFFTILIFISPTFGALQQGFTTKLINRDSPLSPLYNPSSTKWDHVKSSIQRSIARINRFSPSKMESSSINDIRSKVIDANGEYAMEVFIGTPPVRQFGIIDTGSDLIWMQCQPCIQCYKQELAIFDPKKSSTYEVQSCDSKSHTIGDISLETFSFISPKGISSTFPRIVFGCGHDNAGTFGEHGSGLIGLGRGHLSLAADQVGYNLDGTFSYCLIPFGDQNATSIFNFGRPGVVSGRGVVSTPLVSDDDHQPPYYYLTLEGISVANNKIPFSNHKHSSSTGENLVNSEGNIIIDSGTALTILPSDFYNDLISALVKAIKGKQVEDPSGTLQLCYQDSSDLKIPNLIAHFTRANLELKPVNTFIKVSDDVTCLAIIPAQNKDISIFGNVAQGNFLVGYDIGVGTVSFMPVDCAKAQGA